MKKINIKTKSGQLLGVELTLNDYSDIESNIGRITCIDNKHYVRMSKFDIEKYFNTKINSDANISFENENEFLKVEKLLKGEEGKRDEIEFEKFINNKSQIIEMQLNFSYERSIIFFNTPKLFKNKFESIILKAEKLGLIKFNMNSNSIFEINLTVKEIENLKEKVNEKEVKNKIDDKYNKLKEEAKRGNKIINLNSSMIFQDDNKEIWEHEYINANGEICVKRTNEN